MSYNRQIKKVFAWINVNYPVLIIICMLSFISTGYLFKTTIFPNIDKRIGVSSQYRVLVISHTYRSETIRIISARQATKREQIFYEHGN
jgi:hypothetical protein